MANTGGLSDAQLRELINRTVSNTPSKTTPGPVSASKTESDRVDLSECSTDVTPTSTECSLSQLQPKPFTDMGSFKDRPEHSQTTADDEKTQQTVPGNVQRLDDFKLLSKEELIESLDECRTELDITKKKLARSERQLQRSNDYNNQLRDMVSKLALPWILLIFIKKNQEKSFLYHQTKLIRVICL